MSSPVQVKSGRRTRRLAGLWLGAATVLNGCGSETTEPAGPPVVASVTIDPHDGRLVPGGTAQLVAVARTASGERIENATFRWESLHPGLATVSATGLVTATAVGSARVRASSGGKSGEIALEIELPANPVPTITGFSPATVAAGGPDLTLRVRGNGFRPNAMLRWNGALRPTTVISETEVEATVWAADIAAVREVQVEVVNAAPGGGASPAVVFQVIPQAVPVAAVELNREVAYTVVGTAVPLGVTLRDGQGNVLTGRLVTWASSNQLVATMNAGGVVMPTGAGEATITATSEGVSATLALSVGARLTHLILGDGGSGLAVLDLRLGGLPATFWEHLAGMEVSEPSVSPNGRWIAYSIRMGGASSIGVLDQATHTYQFLAADGLNDQPAWSPAGDRIAMRSHRDGRSEVWVTNLDGTAPVNLTATMPDGYEAGWPAWSPDGTRLVFAGGRIDGPRALYIINADGTGLRPLLISGHDDTEPAWHGTGVVFTRASTAGQTDLYRIDVVFGGAAIQLTHTGQAGAAAWSPDGRWIAFTDGPAIAGRHDIKAVRPFGEEIRMLSARATGGGGKAPTWLSHQ